MSDNMMGMGGMGSQFGIINSLRTGNMMIDMLVCMLIPLFFQGVATLWDKLTPEIKKWIDSFRNDPQYCTKTLSYECRTTSWGSVINSGGKEERNNILQKAVRWYVAELKIDLDRSKLSFMAIKEKTSRENYETVYGSNVEQLLQYSVCTLPPEGKWIPVRDKLELMLETEEPDGDEKNKNVSKTNTVFTFRSLNPGGEEVIDAFVKDAYDFYLAKMKATQDFSRYLYMLVKTSKKSSDDDDGGSDDNVRVYKRYKLSDEKSFDCIFFKEKEMLLKLLDHFMNKTGRYAIKGFPHKLGLLLHGPPGTGKTSLIKAMAQHTGRHVVSIPLARIETNQELMDIVFDQTFAVKGEDIPLKHSFKDVIFVMEDVDAASPIVMSRAKPEDKKGDEAKKEVKTNSVPSVKEENEDDLADLETSKLDSDDKEKKDDEKESEKGKDDKGESEVDKKANDSQNKEAGMMGAILSSLLDPGGSSKDSGAGGYSYKSLYASKSDRLDLAGLLNVLDGVVDCPNRILIMTTNHPEKLDAALIRPGRIDKIMKLGHMEIAQARQMVEHYFQTKLTDSQFHRLDIAFNTKCTKNGENVAAFSPAEIEQMCAEHDDVQEFIDDLEQRISKLVDVTEALTIEAPPPLSASLSRTVSRREAAESNAALRRGFSTAASDILSK